MKPIRRINYSPTLAQLKRRARIHGLQIHKDKYGNFILVDRATNTVAEPAPMSIIQVENWLDDLTAAG